MFADHKHKHSASDINEYNVSWVASVRCDIIQVADVV